MYSLDNEFVQELTSITKIDNGLDFILSHVDNLLCKNDSYKEISSVT